MNSSNQYRSLKRTTALAAAACAVLTCCTQAASVQFYVSPQGRDNWSGRLPKPSLLHTDGPFRTLHRARAAVRAVREHENEAGEIVVLIRQGTYRLTEPFVLNEADSGRERGPTVYQAFPDEEVRLVGSVPVTGWQSCYNGTYRADMARPEFENVQVTDLFFRGSRQHLARTPNADPSHPRSGGFLYVRVPPAPGQNEPALRTDPTRIRPERWSIPARMRVHLWSGTAPALEEILPLEARGHRPGIIVLEHPPRRNVEAGTRFFVENAYAELDAPGEWFYDADSRQLYFRPPDGRNPDQHVTIPLASHLLDLRGTPDDPDKRAANIRIEGLVLAETRDALVTVDRADQCELVDSLLLNCGKSAVVIGADATRIRIARCDITAAGKGAITIHGRSTNGNVLTPACNVITENHIFETGEKQGHAAAIQVGDPEQQRASAGNVITHNLIHDTAGPALAICGTRTTCDYNRVHHTSLASSHNAAIEVFALSTAGDDPGGVLRFNWISDTGGYTMIKPGQWAFPARTAGIRVHAGTPPLAISGNCIHGAPQACIHIIGKTPHRIENNLLYGHAESLLRIQAAPHGETQPQTAGCAVTQNVFAIAGSDSEWLRIEGPQELLAESDWNCLWAGDHQLTATLKTPSETLTWKQWQDRGHDLRSAVADPMLQDPEAGDFTLDARSLALKLGFVPIPFSRIGLTNPGERRQWTVGPEPVRENYLRHPGGGPIERLP